MQRFFYMALMLCASASTSVTAETIAVRDAVTPPQLDGIRDDRVWQYAEHLVASPDSPSLSANQLAGNAQEAAGVAGTAADVSADFWLSWDADALYFIAQVRDNVHDVSGSGEARNWWERDSLSLYIDLVNADDAGTPYTALNIINFMAAPQASAPETVTLEYTDNNGARVFTQSASDLAGIEYAYRDAASEFGGQADYVLEAKVPWATLMRFNLAQVPSVSETMGLSIIVLDPDGEDGFGGQLQAWGMADRPSTYADIVYKGLVKSTAKAGGGSSGRVFKPVASEKSPWGKVKGSLHEGSE